MDEAFWWADDSSKLPSSVFCLRGRGSSLIWFTHFKVLLNALEINPDIVVIRRSRERKKINDQRFQTANDKVWRFNKVYTGLLVISSRFCVVYCQGYENTSFIIFIFLLWSDCQSSEWVLLLKTHHTDKRNRQENVNERIFSLRKTSLPLFYDCYSGESVVQCWGYFSIQSYQTEKAFRKIIILTDVLIRRWNCKEIITFSLQTQFLTNSTLAILNQSLTIIISTNQISIMHPNHRDCTSFFI